MLILQGHAVVAFQLPQRFGDLEAARPRHHELDEDGVKSVGVLHGFIENFLGLDQVVRNKKLDLEISQQLSHFLNVHAIIVNEQYCFFLEESVLLSL